MDLKKTTTKHPIKKKFSCGYHWLSSVAGVLCFTGLQMTDRILSSVASNAAQSLGSMLEMEWFPVPCSAGTATIAAYVKVKL